MTDTSPRARSGPLSHGRVLDSAASQIFVDLGADAIKVERPVAGDDMRIWAPPFLEDGGGNPTNNSDAAIKGLQEAAVV